MAGAEPPNLSEPPLPRFFINLTRHMRRHGDTIDDVVQAAGCSSQTSYFKWRRGGGISERRLRRLAHRYGTEPAALRYASDEVDHDALEAIIELLENHLGQHGVNATPHRKAKLISYLYEQYIMSPEPLAATVPKLVEAATA